MSGKKNMNRLVILFCTFLMMTYGCASYYKMATKSPAARAPSLYKVVRPDSADEKVIPNLKGEYELLPTDIIVIQVETPYMTGLQVDIDGDVLAWTDHPERQEILETADKGYYTSTYNSRLSTREKAIWEIAVYPHPSLQESEGFNINIRSISPNPRYTGIERVSAPLTIRVVH